LSAHAESVEFASWFGLVLLATAAACEPIDRKLGELSLPATSDAESGDAVATQDLGEPEVVFRDDSRVNSGLWVSDDGEVWIAGYEPSTGAVARGFVALLVEDRLQLKTTQSSELRSVWSCDGGTVHAVGGITTHSAEWLPSRSPSGGLLRDVWGADCDNLVAVGDDGAIARYDGSEWALVDEKPTAAHLHSVWGTSADNIFAVGDEGTIVRFDGTAWSLVESGRDVDLLGVWGVSEIEFYAVGGRKNGEQAVVLEYNGRIWQEAAHFDGFQLHAVHGDRSGRVLAVGGQPNPDQSFAAVLQRGDAWSETIVRGLPSLNDVWIGTSSDALAVGERGVVIRIPVDGGD